MNKIKWSVELRETYNHGYNVFLIATSLDTTIEQRIVLDNNITLSEKYLKTNIYKVLKYFDDTINKKDVIESLTYDNVCSIILQQIIKAPYNAALFIIDDYIWEIYNNNTINAICIRLTRYSKNRYTIQKCFLYSMVKYFKDIPNKCIEYILNDIVSILNKNTCYKITDLSYNKLDKVKNVLMTIINQIKYS